MSATDYVAVGAAILAVLFSTGSLILSRRWHERDRAEDRSWYVQQQHAQQLEWQRDNLLEAVLQHLNLSFQIGTACRRAGVARKIHNVAGIAEHYDKANQLHAAYMDQMVYLRLLGSAELVTAAEGLHQALDHMLDLAFDEEVKATGANNFTKSPFPDPPPDAVQARTRCMDQRQALINEARAFFGLSRDAQIDRTI